MRRYFRKIIFPVMEPVATVEVDARPVLLRSLSVPMILKGASTLLEVSVGLPFRFSQELCRYLPGYGGTCRVTAPSVSAPYCRRAFLKCRRPPETCASGSEKSPISVNRSGVDLLPPGDRDEEFSAHEFYFFTETRLSNMTERQPVCGRNDRREEADR